MVYRLWVVLRRLWVVFMWFVFLCYICTLVIPFIVFLAKGTTYSDEITDYIEDLSY